MEDYLEAIFNLRVFRVKEFADGFKVRIKTMKEVRGKNNGTKQD